MPFQIAEGALKAFQMMNARFDGKEAISAVARATALPPATPAARNAHWKPREMVELNLTKIQPPPAWFCVLHQRTELLLGVFWAFFFGFAPWTALTTQVEAVQATQPLTSTSFNNWLNNPNNWKKKQSTPPLNWFTAPQAEQHPTGCSSSRINLAG